jgi:protein disulfide-isomerase
MKLIGFILAIGLAPAGAAELPWHTNLTRVLAIAKTEQKPVLLKFSSPDSEWCGECKNFEKEVCRTTEFQNYARTNFVLMAIDEDKAPSPHLKEAIKALEEKHDVASWPTLIVLDAKGETLGRVIGYTSGTGCKNVIADLEKVRQKP